MSSEEAGQMQAAAEAALAEVPCTCGKPGEYHQPGCARVVVATYMFPVLEAARPHIAALELKQCPRLAEQEAKRMRQSGANLSAGILRDFAKLLRNEGKSVPAARSKAGAAYARNRKA